MNRKIITLVIPGVPPSLNKFGGRENSWEYRNEKKKWTELVTLIGKTQRPEKPFDYSIVTLTYRFKDRRRRDPDNYNGKFLMDGLTQSGIIADDSFKHIELRTRAEKDVGEERTTITIEEVI